MLKEDYTEKVGKVWKRLVCMFFFTIISSSFVFVKVSMFAEHVNLVVENMKLNAKNNAKMKTI